MSHELRTPLNAVIGFAEMISGQKLGPIQDARYVEFASLISSSGDHLLSVINDILDLSSLDAGAISLDEEELDLADVVAETRQMMVGQAGKTNITISVDLPASLPFVRADRRRMRQIILNILANAVKFTPEGGSVHVSGRDSAEEVAIVIRDTGVGIAAEDIPRVFERFGQVDNSLARRHDGTGLGLPLSQDLARLHGGELTLESEPGVGTTVTISLPASRICDRAPARSTTSGSDRPEAKQKVA